MPKRGRDGAVLIQSHHDHFPVPRSLKRPAEWELEQMPDFKRFHGPGISSCSSSSSNSITLPTSNVLKRPADFDIELQHLNKRLRASIPTAEEAIAFLLPHIEKLRQLYMQEKNKSKLLESKCIHMASIINKKEAINKKVMDTLCHTMSEKEQLERELKMAKYRLALTDQQKFSGIV